MAELYTITETISKASAEMGFLMDKARLSMLMELSRRANFKNIDCMAMERLFSLTVQCRKVGFKMMTFNNDITLIY